jgi:uncharacterized protein (TIGR02118 family)
MIKATVLYANQEGGRFDIDYYCNKHMPMVAERLGAACKGMSVEQGISGMMPGTPAAFAVIAQMTFESVEAFQNAFAPHAAEILADIPNYTTIQPVIQFSEVKM